MYRVDIAADLNDEDDLAPAGDGIIVHLRLLPPDPML
jgi:hypothetical protein